VLRPFLNLHGANYVADKFVDIVVPLIAVAGWVVFGPRRGSRATPCGASSCGRSLGSATPC
jgi:hypothetical protein